MLARLLCSPPARLSAACRPPPSTPPRFRPHSPLPPPSRPPPKQPQSPEAYASPEASVLTRLLVKLLQHELNEVTYPAELAGAAYSASNTLSGLQVVASGYSDTLPALVSALFAKLAALKAGRLRVCCVCCCVLCVRACVWGGEG